MTRDEWARVKEIVGDALARPAAERAAYVTASCAADPAIEREVESLLAATVLAASLYENPSVLVDGAPPSVGAFDLPFSPGLLDDLAPVPDPARQPFAGTDRYVVRCQIGAGGMGVVYEVEDRARRQVVALKTLSRWRPEDIYRLKHEFRALADIAHPNLAAFYDLVVGDEQCFFTMEFIDGVTFVEYVGGPVGVSIERVRLAFAQLVAGVDELHRRGKLHRDIKPSNVLVTPRGRVVILDFGLTSNRARSDDLERGVAGTPAYLSPEQCAGGEASDASDWYSVGATLYHALTGHPPFGGSVAEVIAKKTQSDPADVRLLAPGVPADLAEICMAMLRRDPARRLRGPEALGRASSDAPPADADGPSARAPAFVGRGAYLQVLRDALASVTAGRNAAVYLHGPSGIGKTALVECFVDRDVSRTGALLLRSRCHERESVPYQGLDGIVDGLSRHLGGLPPAEIAPLLPDDTPALVRLFPVLQIPAAARAPAPIAGPTDPAALRRRAFAALRDLVTRVARRQPLVIEIDDFHWADADSAASLAALLKPPDPPPILLVVSFRSEEMSAKPFLQALIDQADMWTRIALRVAPLSSREVHALISARLPPGRQAAEGERSAIEHEAGGNPLLVEELTRAIAAGRALEARTIGEIFARRLDALPAESRAFLRTLSVCGRPVSAARIFEAIGGSGDERPLVARLQAAHFVRHSRSADHVEVYHDRLREAIAAGVSAEEARAIHAHMAELLVARGEDDPEALYEHYRGAGEAAAAAAEAATAAARAGEVLAFDRAATLYREALALQPHADRRAAWTAGLARALEYAGRPAAAADAWLDAARESSGAGRVDAERKAAEQLLMGGHIDRGLAIIDALTPAVGVRLPRSPHRAAATLLLGRARLAWRGLDFTPRHESRIPARELLRIDTGWAVSTGLMLVDTLRAAAFHAVHVRLALDTGEPYRVARALALEAAFSAAGGGAAGLARSTAFAARAEAVASTVHHPHVVALSTLTAGIAAFVLGQWTTATTRCERALAMLRDECTGVVWELTLAHNFCLGSLFYRGRLRQVSQWVPGLLDTARERGNLYFEVELTTRFNMIWLAADDPDGGEREADAANARWSARGFHRQHYNHLHARVQTALYRGRADEAWRLVQEQMMAVRRTLWLRVQLMRVETAFLEARCALAVAGDGRDVRRMRAMAERAARRLARENTTMAAPMACLVNAGIAYLDGDRDRAVSMLTKAVDAFDAADVQLHAAVARRRLGALVGGETGRALCRQAEAWMTAEGIRKPSAMCQVLAPGLPEP